MLFMHLIYIESIKMSPGVNPLTFFVNDKMLGRPPGTLSHTNRKLSITVAGNHKPQCHFQGQ